MKYQIMGLLGLVGFALTGCKQSDSSDNVLSERYIHKYGYALSKEDWTAKTYPGQVVTALRSGVTVTTTYDNGMQHGPTTYTYPHSQAIERYELYNLGIKVRELNYDASGIPEREWIQLSPSRHSLSSWYKSGSPMSVEEFTGAELLEGHYFNEQNEMESRVEKGVGLRVCRDRVGSLLSKEVIEGGYPVKKETFFSNGAPESIAYYLKGALHGEKRTFSPEGEPLAIEEWVNNKLHGKALYFKNGNRYLEVSYLYGQKEGLEREFVDGERVSQEVFWENGLKHGEAVFYSEGKNQSQWFYAGRAVSKQKFEELNRLDAVISQLPYSSESKQRR